MMDSSSVLETRFPATSEPAEHDPDRTGRFRHSSGSRPYLPRVGRSQRRTLLTPPPLRVPERQFPAPPRDSMGIKVRRVLLLHWIQCKGTRPTGVARPSCQGSSAIDGETARLSVTLAKAHRCPSSRIDRRTERPLARVTADDKQDWFRTPPPQVRSNLGHLHRVVSTGGRRGIRV
jgi:hypothetical protein